jgi:hypothetical protein
LIKLGVIKIKKRRKNKNKRLQQIDAFEKGITNAIPFNPQNKRYSDFIASSSAPQMMPYTDNLRLRDANDNFNTRLLEYKNDLTGQKLLLNDQQEKQRELENDVDIGRQIIMRELRSVSYDYGPSGFSYDDNIVINQSIESFPIDTIKKLWEVMQLYINFSMYLIYLKSDFTNKTIKDYLKKYKLTKKISNLANIYKSIRFSIYSSNDYSFNEHYLRINNTKAKLVDLKVGFKYFIKSIETNKFFQIEINNINDTIVHTENNQAFIYSNYEWYFYISNLDFTYDLIIFQCSGRNSKELV